MDFASTKYEVADAFAFNELYQDNGWTDGLPIVPPTDGSCERFWRLPGWHRAPSLPPSRCADAESPLRKSRLLR